MKRKKENEKKIKFSGGVAGGILRTDGRTDRAINQKMARKTKEKIYITSRIRTSLVEDFTKDR